MFRSLPLATRRDWPKKCPSDSTSKSGAIQTGCRSSRMGIIHAESKRIRLIRHHESQIFSCEQNPGSEQYRDSTGQGNYNLINI